MREVVIVKRCDECGQDAPRSFVAGVNASESAPKLRLLDLCDAHAAPVLALADLLGGAAPFTANGSQLAMDESAEAFDCEICGRPYSTRNGAAEHIWLTHVGMPKPISTLTDCPECDRAFGSAQAVAVHRRHAHGWDTLQDAYTAAQMA